MAEHAGRNIDLESSLMPPLLIGFSSIALASLVTDDAARREEFKELKGGLQL